jgi:hypothetical protein
LKELDRSGFAEEFGGKGHGLRHRTPYTRKARYGMNFGVEP